VIASVTAVGRVVILPESVPLEVGADEEEDEVVV